MNEAKDALPPSLRSLSHRVIKADSNGVSYDILVWVPTGYEESQHSYPLLIVLDGAMMMGTVVEAVSVQSVTGEALPLIIVGVSTAAPLNHGLQRSIDYSADVPSYEVPPGAKLSIWEFYKDLFSANGLEYAEGFGGTDEFYAFLTEQLLPELQNDVRIDPDDIGIGGHSSGGDFAVDTLLRKETPFSKFIVGSFGADVLARRLPERERAFAELTAPRPLQVFCGFGGEELADPNLHHYIQSGIDLLQRLQETDPGNLTITIREYERENHGSVFSHIFSSGIRELWGSGKTMADMMEQAMLSGIPKVE